MRNPSNATQVFSNKFQPLTYHRTIVSILLVALAFIAGVIGLRLRSVQAAGTISGTVFLDFNSNGAFDTSGTAPNVAVDKGLVAVTVTAYDAGGASRGTTTTAANGTYSLAATGTGPYRVEFTNLPAGYSPSARSTDSVNGGTAANSGSTVQFVADGATTNVNLAVSQPDDYCQNNPLLCTTFLRPGNASQTRSSVISFPYISPTGQTNLTNESVTGAVWGAAYQPTSKTLFVSAMMKRHAGFGPLGTGGIYKVDLNTGTPSATSYINLQTIGLNTGVNPRTTAGYTLPNTGATPHWDYAAYTQVGKIGIGDIDFDAQRNTLWFVNLADRRLHGITNVNPAVAPTSANVLKDATNTPGFLVNTSPAVTCTNGVLRPWAVKPYRGLIYVGAVCTGENVGATAANLTAYLFSFNPENSSAGFTQVLSFALNYTRTKAAYGGDIPWNPWTNSDANIAAAVNGDLPQPIFSDIEFDVDGSLIMGLADRWGDQVAGNQYRADPTQTNTTLTPESYGQGDMLRFCKSGASFANPGTAQCPNNPRPAAENGANSGGSQGPGGGEFYGGDWGPDDPDSFGDVSHGGFAFLPGSGQVVVTVHDARAYYSGGAQWLSNTDGSNQSGFDVYTTTSLNNTDTFNKGNGLGDLELLCDAAPLEVGNRIWKDTNGNGRQDSDTTATGEPGLSNVAVQLWADTNSDGKADTQVGSATTDTNGEYYFGGSGKSNMLNNASCSTTVTATTGASTNDAEQTGTTVSTTSTTLDLARTTGGADNTVGLRFSGLNIPKGANVTSATIQFNARNSDAGTPVNVTIRGENNDNAAAFTTTNNDISNRPTTTQSVNWSGIPAWTLDQTTNATTPNLETILDAVVARSGWASGNSLAFVISNNGTTGTTSRRGKSFDNSAANSPLLTVTYQCPFEVQPKTNYEVRVPATNFNAGQALNGYQLTQVNADTDANAIVDTNDDRRDSDGTFATVNGGGNSVLVAFNTGSAGQNDHTFDFGFRLATGNPVSLGNRVYLDNGGGTAANANNGTFDTGETGLAGVTLELFNSGGTTLLATTLTDANGYYSFPGLTSGSAYHVCVAASNFNSGGPLANYGSSTGNSTEGATTPDANTAADLRDKGTTMGTPGAGGFVETRVAVALTAGSAPTGEENGAGDTNPDNSHNLKVDFGFINYSLGNRVWLDNGAGGGVSNDGIINGSEAGISGVAVSLFADATCDGAIDTPSTPLATVTTDSNGYYRFDNLKTVCYIVRVNPSNFQTGGPLAARTNSAGNVNAGSNTTDSRDNGINNSNELTNGVLSNSINFATKAKPTGETNPGSYGSGATNGPAAADTADDLTVDFGFIIGAPSVVTLSDFAAYGDGATTLLQWRTGSETDNLGYFVYRRSGPGEAVRLNDEPIAGSAFKVAQGTTLTAGDLYYWRDQFVAGAEYYLEAVALDGKKQQFGPAPVKTDAAAVARAASAPNARLLSQLAANRAVTPTVPLLPKAVRSAMRLEFNDDALAQQRLLAAGPALQIGVKQSGWYRVSGAQLEAAGLEAVPDARLLQLYADGREVPCLVRAGREAGALGPDDTLEFYGFGLDERESDTRVYWLVNGARPGLRYGAPARSVTRGAENGGKDSASAPQSAANSFMNTVERRERSIYVPSIDNGEDTENFFGAIINRTPLNQTLELAQVDSAASATARLEVVLQGATPSAHRIRVQLNGQLLGFLEGNGKVLYSQRFDIVHSALNEGANTVTLNAEGDGDVSVVDYVRVVYARRYQAADNQLFFTLEARRSAQVGGFNTPNVRLFDFTEPERGYQVAAKVGSDAAGYTLSVEPGLRARALFAVSAANTLTPAFLRRNEASAWTTPEHQADFLIITPRAFRAAAQPLANVRSAQGLRTVVVNLEDIFDETTGGSKRVHALRYFLRYAQEKWQAGAQYALFLGDASVDARNYLALGDNDLVPTGYVSTVYLETMSDESLVDFNGDGLGEIAVGRLPARDLAQAQMLVGKTLGYQPRSLTDSALLVADRPDGYNFAQMNQQTAAALPAGTNATQLVRGTQPDAELRAVIFNALNQGPALVNFAGHGSTETWTGAPLLQRSDAAQLSNGGNQLSVYVMLTCLNGYFASATSESLAEGLINAPNGGAVAVWASTGLSAATGQQLAAREFYQRAYGATPYRLGDATRAAKAQTTDPDVRATWTLFADPTLLVRY